MPSMLVGAPFESSSMLCTYPRTTKPSKQRRKRTQKPIPHSSLLWTSFSEPPLRCGHRCRRCGNRCRRCGFLHSPKKILGKMVKEKSKDGGSNEPRADWSDPTELQAFCQFCAAQVLAGQRKAGFLSKNGVDNVIEQLADIGKVVTHLQIKNKWDHMKKGWTNYNKCFENESGLGYDPGTGKIDAPDEWWTRKIAACPIAKSFRTKGLPNREFLNIMYGGTVATGKNAFCTSGQIPKESTEGSGDSADSTEFVDPQCEPFVNVDAMEVEGPSSSRAGPRVSKGKGLATSVHIFKPIIKRSKKKRSVAQEMSDSLKSISNVIVESRSVSTRMDIASTATTQVKAILDMVLSLPGVHSGHYLHLFSTLYFMEKERGRHMFAALGDNKDVQLKWLEKEYQRHPEFHFD